MPPQEIKKDWICFYNQIFGFIECDDNRFYFFIAEEKPFLKTATIQSRKLGKEYEKIKIHGEPNCEHFGLT